jgi:hypothetical protein
MRTVLSEERGVSDLRVKVIRSTLQPGYTVGDYVHPPCTILPHPYPVRFDIEDEGDMFI